MPEALSAALAQDGLIWVALAAFVAGLVRGFSGFGTAMIYLPVAAQFLPPVWAVTTLVVMDFFGPLPILRGAWRDCFPGDLARLGLGSLLAVPLGALLLTATEPDIYRYAVSGLALILLVCLLSGLRYRRVVTPNLLFGIGGTAGFLGGVTGVPGPVVILFYMVSPHGPAAIRANTLFYLFGFDVLLLATLLVSGALAAVPVWLGLLLAVPTLLGNMAGGAIFNPGHERLYRGIAYAIIAASALFGLPLWD